MATVSRQSSRTPKLDNNAGRPPRVVPVSPDCLIDMKSATDDAVAAIAKLLKAHNALVAGANANLGREAA